MITVPYSKLELKLSAIEAQYIVEKLDPETLSEIEKEVAEVAKKFDLENEDKTPPAHLVAEFHGISTKQLANSPNYKILCDDFETASAAALVTILQKVGKMNNIQAWGALMASNNFL